MQSLGTNWIVVSHFFPQKIGEFLSSGPEGLIFKPQEFYFVTLTSHANVGLKLNAAFQITFSNDLHRSFTLWHWKTMQSLGQNCILLSRSAQKRFDQFISSEGKVSKFLSFISLFYVKDKLLESKSLTGVSFCDREKPSKVWVKTESCFPDQPPPIPKEIGEFLSSRQEESKFQIILFLCFL